MAPRTQHILIYLVYTVVFALSIMRDEYVFRNSTSIDLLYRVVGSRLMKDGRSPYYGKWHANEPQAERYYHPIPRYSQQVNGVTVTPSILWLQQPWADDDFCSTAKSWFYLQLILLYASGLLLLYALGPANQKLIAVFVFAIFFAFSRNLYLHLHSAQVYLVYGFVFALLFVLLRSRFTGRFILTGILLAIATWLKPFFIFALIPFLVQRNWRVLKGYGAMALILLLQVIATHQTGTWREYSKAMPQYATDIFSRDDTAFLQLQPPPFAVPDCMYPMRTPEGVSLNATGLVSVQYYLKRMHLPVPQPAVFGVMAFSIALVLAWIFRRRQSSEQLLALMFLLYLVAELFTPAMRMGYYLVEWLAAATVIVATFKKNPGASLLMIVGLIINNGYVPLGAQSGAIGEAIMVIALLVQLSGKKGSDDRVEQLV